MNLHDARPRVNPDARLLSAAANFTISAIYAAIGLGLMAMFSHLSRYFSRRAASTSCRQCVTTCKFGLPTSLVVTRRRAEPRRGECRGHRSSSAPGGGRAVLSCGQRMILSVTAWYE